jgi:hypothetical protein
MEIVRWAPLDRNEHAGRSCIDDRRIANCGSLPGAAVDVAANNQTRF